MSKRKKLAIIGNGMASSKLVEEIVANEEQPYQITVFGDEPHESYNHILLSPVLAGDKNLDDIQLHAQGWYEDNGIQLKLGGAYRVKQIDRHARQLYCENGETFQYDRLVIATGSKPTFLPIPGNTLDGVMGFRDIHDVQNMIARSDQAPQILVIGAGLLGLEAAAALAGRGAKVSVVNRAAHPLNRQLDREAGHLLQSSLEQRNIDFLMQRQTVALKGKQGKVCAAIFDDGSELATDLVIMTAGITPNIQLALESGLQCDKGILVSDTLQTFDPAIYALGECVQHKDSTFGLVAPIYDQAKVLANHLCEHGVAEFKPLPSATKLKVSGIDLFSIGQFEGDAETEQLEFRDPSNGTYKKLVLKNGKMIGALLYGDVAEGPFYQSLIDEQKDVSPIRPFMMFGEALSKDQQPSFFQS